MKQLYLLLTIAIWFSLILGAGLALYPRLKSMALSTISGLLALVLVFFFIEHFVGLGDVGYLMPIGLVLSLGLMYLRRHAWPDIKEEVLAFAACFAWGLAWRMMLPNMDGGTEKLMNLELIASYRTGLTLPPPDMWLAGHNLDMYYGLQHYAAALMGRIMHFSVGANYHFAFATIIGLIGMTAWGSMRQWALMQKDPNESLWWRALIIVALLGGGTGVAPFTYLIFPDMDPLTHSWANVRFMGAYENQAGEWARTIFTPQNKLDLPMEVMGYFMHIGDFHAVLGGFLLAALLCLVMAYQIRLNFQVPKLLPVLMGAMLILPIAMNMWILPLLVLIEAAFLYIHRAKLKEQWLYMALGFVATTILLQPFFSYFLPSSLGVGLKLVAADQHSPLIQYLILMWPLWVLAAVGLAAKDKTGMLRFLAITCVVVLLFSEFFVFDDSRGGTPSRFNTTLKYWSWTFVLVLVGIAGHLVVQAQQKWARYAVATVAVLLSFHLFDLLYGVSQRPCDNWGNLSGEGWIPGRAWAQKDLFEYLRGAPRGIVLEEIGYEAYVDQSSMALLAEKPSLIGWINHENLWRGGPPYIGRLASNIEQLYKGENPNALDWLLQNDVRYVLVTARKPMTAEVQAKIQAQIGSAYSWQEFGKAPLVGVWIRK